MTEYWAAFEWLIMNFLSFANWTEIIDTANDLNCNLYLSWSHVQRNEDGYYVIGCRINAPSEEACNTWLQKLEQYVAILDFQALQQINIQIEPLNEIDDRSLINLMSDINHLVECNQAIRNNTPMWLSIFWVIRPMPTEHILEWIRIAQKWNAYLFYELPFQPSLPTNLPKSWLQTLYLKVNQVATSDKLLADLKPFPAGEHWWWIFSDRTNQLDVDKLFPLNTDTVDAFQVIVRDKSNL